MFDYARAATEPWMKKGVSTTPLVNHVGSIIDSPVHRPRGHTNAFEEELGRSAARSTAFNPYDLSLNTGMFSFSTEVATSLELRFLIDRHLIARRAGNHQVAAVYANAAEGLVKAAMPAIAMAISGVASRKGDGRLIGSALAQSVSPMGAAAICIVWLCRQARRPAVDALAEAFRNEPTFNDAIRILCSRAFPPVGITAAGKPGS